MKAKILIILFSIVLIVNMYILIQNNFVWEKHYVNYAGVVSSALLIVSQVIGIKQRQKTGQHNR